MIGLTARAEKQVLALRRHYRRLGRIEAVINLLAALELASDRIAADPHTGHPFPARYHNLGRPGQLWVKAGRYWIRYRTSKPIAITAIFYDQANIPGRL